MHTEAYKNTFWKKTDRIPMCYTKIEPAARDLWWRQSQISMTPQKRHDNEWWRGNCRWKTATMDDVWGRSVERISGNFDRKRIPSFSAM